MKPTTPALATLVLTGALLAGCAGRSPAPSSQATVPVPWLADAVAVDGQLDEPCYRQAPFATEFVIAGEPARQPARTRAWLFWSTDRLLFAFDCDDARLVTAPPSANERAVDPQDRVELFLWSGRPTDAYYCIEIAAAGAVHDYAARFYRQFDDAWSPGGLQYAVTQRPGGYRVEAALSRSALEGMGFRLDPGAALRAGLFRADFVPDRPEAPDWITWVDARTPQPDFHVAGAFGRVVLQAGH